MSDGAIPRPRVAGRRNRFFDALDERLGISGLAYPVPEHANKLAYSLGGLSLACFILLVASGIILTQFYNSDPTMAHESVRNLITSVTLGKFLRAFHYWTAMAMIILVGLHLIRVFVSGSFKRPREGNWTLGVILATLAAGFFFSGTVLKWDQESLEALEHNIAIGKLLGGFGFWFADTFGGVPLLGRLYVVHIALLPALFTLVVAVHLLLVKRHGMAPSPFRRGVEPEPTEPFTGHLLRLGAFALVLVGVVAIVAAFLPPAHGAAPIEGIEVTKPPWPLLWLYPLENLIGLNGILYGTIALLAILFLVPVLDHGPERAPRKRLPFMIGGAVVVVAIFALIIIAKTTGVVSHLGM